MNLSKKTFLLSPLFLLSCATQTIVASEQPVQPANTSTTTAATTSSSESDPLAIFKSEPRVRLSWDKARRERRLSTLRAEEQEIINRQPTVASAFQSREKFDEYINSRASLIFNRSRQEEVQKNIDITTRALEKLNQQEEGEKQ